MNDGNLIPLTARAKSEQREIQALGGKANGEQRRKKKRFAEFVQGILEAPVTEAGQVKYNEQGEPLTTKEALALKLVRFAFDGDLRALQMCLDFVGECQRGQAVLDVEAETVTELQRIERIHDFLNFRRHEGGTCFVYGTTRSGKTYAIVQWLLDSLEAGKLTGRILVCGQTVPFLRNGVAAYIREMADSHPGLKVMQRGFEVRGEHGLISLQSFDNPARALSSQWSCIYANEGNIMDLATVDALRVRNSGLFICDYNPSVNDWWGASMVDTGNSLFCSFRDNPFLSDNQLANIEAIRERGESAAVGSYDYWFYSVYYLGKFAEMGGGVFTRLFRTTRKKMDGLSERLLEVWGIDFGDTADPNALVRVFVDTEAQAVYVECRYYQTATDDIKMVDILRACNVQRLVFETATGGNTRARNFRALGFQGRLIECEKERVSSSVFNLSAYSIYCVDDVSFNEFKNYRVEGGKFHGADHCIDAVRYVFHLILTNKIRR